MITGYYNFIHANTPFHLYDIPALIILIVLVIVVLVHRHNQRKRAEKFEANMNETIELASKIVSGDVSFSETSDSTGA